MISCSIGTNDVEFARFRLVAPVKRYDFEMSLQIQWEPNVDLLRCGQRPGWEFEHRHSVIPRSIGTRLEKNKSFEARDSQ